MIAKIGRSSNLYGALAYNNRKVQQGNGKILWTNKMIETPNGQYTIPQLIESFYPYLAANRNTEKHTLHISLNPNPKDRVSDNDFIKLAEEYMKDMGYGDQPYVVFKHTDIDRIHIHIVSVTVDEYGRKISDRFEKRRSMQVCRKLEHKYNLVTAAKNQNEKNEMSVKPVDYYKGNIKNQLSSVIRNLCNNYRFKTFGEYNALLSLFNISVEKVEGELGGRSQTGLVYFVLDNKKNRMGRPLKSSKIGKSVGVAAIESYFQKSKTSLQNNSYKTLVKRMVENALQETNKEKDFIEALKSKGINTIIRRNNTGRMYGITFVDHNTKTVWNGSGLGKELSANSLDLQWRTDKCAGKTNENDFKSKLPRLKIDYPSFEVTHYLFDFLEVADLPYGAHNDVIDGFEGLFNFISEPDPHEEDFTRQMKKRKRKKS
ncbi:conjugal transfer protein MobB [Chryseobacterium sp. SIMBA_038]|uniref:conjugal transfer protein MobB n=1 Tax=Chryseobacterium sp. SIMBA_038 TaxID=3085780 RepID=UPI00397C16D4